jgi:hypothetical protein
VHRRAGFLTQFPPCRVLNGFAGITGSAGQEPPTVVGAQTTMPPGFWPIR